MVRQLGFIERGTGKHQSNCVYSNEGLSPALCANEMTKSPIKVVTKWKK